MDPAAADPLDAQNQRFLDTVDRIVQRVNLTQGHEGSPSATLKLPNATTSGPLTAAELGELSFLCSMASTLPASTEERPTGFAAVEADQLGALTELLDRHINLATQMNLIQQAHDVVQETESSTEAASALNKWMQHRGSHNATVIRMGLEAASIVIFMAVSQGVDRRATNEDAIEASISLMRSHLQKNLIPALCTARPIVSTQATTEEKIKAEESPTKRRKVSHSNMSGTISPNTIRTAQKLIAPTVNAQIILVERLVALVRLIPLDDQQILMLTSPAMAVLEIDCLASTSVSLGNSLQKAYIPLVTEAFRRYKHHRETILEDLFPIMLRLPTGKRTTRACHLSYLGVPSGASFAAFNASLLQGLIPNAPEPHFIQMMTAMLLGLVQACIARPNYELPDNSGSNKQQAEAFSNGLQECRMVVDFFCTQLLTRCSRKKSVMEFRPVLVNLVEDLLLCLLLPEYPAAEMLLSRILSLLTIDMKRSSPSSNSKPKQALETTYLNTAFDLIGKIGSVQARILAVYREKGLHLSSTQVAAGGADDELHMGCYCGNPSVDGRLAVECDHCRISYHASCVNYEDGTVEEEWLCDACKLCRLRDRERRQYEEDGEGAFIDESYALYQSFFSFLSHRVGAKSKELQDATQFHLSRWVNVLNQPKENAKGPGPATRPLRTTRNLLDFWDRPGPGAEPLTDEGTNRLIMSLSVRTSQLFKCFHPQISIILQLMSDGSHVLRKLSLKAIEKTAEGDPTLMAMKHITEGVSRRFNDESISVRDAAIALVGAYVVSTPNVADSFHSSLLPCLSDSGVSVRKRAVKILEGILMANATYRGRAQACSVLLQRAADPKEEDSVRDAIYDLFTNMWLRGGKDVVATVPVKRRLDTETAVQSPSSADHFASAKLVTPTPTNLSNQVVHLKRSDIAAEQMMKVVRSGGTSVHLESLLKALVEGVDVEKSERKKRSAVNQKYRDELVDSLFELLISVEEQRSARSSRVAKDISATLQTIVTFCDLAPNAVLRQTDVLLPFLKADNGVCFEDETSIISAVCDIMYRLATALGAQAASRLSSLKIAKDLRDVTCKFPPSTIESAIRAWSTIIQNEEKENSDFSKKFLALFRSFYRHLAAKDAEFEDFSSAVQGVRDSVHRSLTIIGFICRFHGHEFAPVDWDAEMDNVTTAFELPPAKDLGWDDAPIASYRIFSRYLMKKDVPTRCKALRGYGGLFLTAPRLLLKLEQLKLIEALMGSTAAIELQHETLRCLQDILVSEEKRIDGGTAKKKTEVEHSVSERISGDQDGDATIFGGILANHADRLCEMTQSGDVHLRDASLKLLEVLLRQGLVNPNDTVPFLFALQGDVDNNSIRSRALRLLMTEAERRPDMIRQRVCAGIKKAYELQRIIYPQKSSVSALVETKQGRFTSPECIFDSLFRESIRSNQKQRLGLYTNLLGQFELYDEAMVDRTASSRKPIPTELTLLAFSSQVLAHLPYNNVADPLFLIHHITAIVGFQGPQVLDRLAAVLRSVGLASDDELDEANACEDGLERAARSKFPKNTSEAKAILSKQFDMEGFNELCHAGAGLTLLLRLKSYLRRLYNLSEARCLAYDPNAKERICDKNIAKNQSIPAFDTSLFIDRKTDKLDVDCLIRQYAEFRTLMREETASSQEAENAASESEKEDDADAPADDDEDEYHSNVKGLVDDKFIF